MKVMKEYMSNSSPLFNFRCFWFVRFQRAHQILLTALHKVHAGNPTWKLISLLLFYVNMLTILV